MQEIELKLALASDDLPRVRRALTAMAGDRRPSRSTLASTYYDTPDRRLMQDELILRVRKQGRRFIQTVKAHDSSGVDLLARGEWEDQIAGGEPDLGAPESGSHVRPLKPDDLRPLFTTLVERTTIMLEPRPGTRIEAALDKGEIRAALGGATEPISEIELELKEGDPAVLYDIALRLMEIAPLRIDLRSKAERGYRLIGGAPPPSALHVMPARLEPSMSVEASLQSIGRRCLAGVLRNEAAALADSAEGVHQMRIAVRRLRAALSAVKPMLPSEHFRWADNELKWLADILAPARNWDVVCQHLLEPVQRALHDEPDLGKLCRAAEHQRRAAYRRAKEAILSPRYSSAMVKLLRWFEARGWRDQPVNRDSARLVAPIGEVAPALIRRSYRKARKRARHFAAQPPRQRHRLRIGLKKLRYTIDFLASLYPKRRTRRFVKRLKAVQDDLGHANDVRAARLLLADLENGQQHAALDRAGGIVLGWHDRGLAEQENRICRHVRRLRCARPFW